MKTKKQKSPVVIKKTSKPQKTLKGGFSFKGIGVFSGKVVSFTAKQSEVDTGIVFIKNNVLIPARIEFVDECPNRTRLLKGSTSVQVVEHLLSTLRGFEIDNAIIETEDDELPILDASAKDFVEKIVKVGTIEQDVNKLMMVVKEPIWVSDPESMIGVVPDSKPRISYFLDHPHPHIGQIADSMVLNVSNFRRFIGPARTFATRAEASYMIENRIVGTDDESLAIVIGPDGPNQNLRHPLEYVHHKMLDIIGDISLAGPEIKGHIIGVKSGHLMNRSLARKIAGLLE